MPVLLFPPALVIAAEEHVPAPGAVVARSAPAQPLAPQQIPGRIVFAAAEPPPYERLGGATTGARWGVVQPVFAPARPALVALEELPPAPGRLLQVRPGTGAPPPARALVAAPEVQAPAPGGATVGRYGFPDPRRPVRAHLVRTEEEPPFAGGAITGTPARTDLTRQQSAGVARACATEEPPPFDGLVFARQFPRVPSERFVVRPLVARTEELRPESGSVAALHAWFQVPAAPRALVARTEELRPESGAALVARAWLDLPPPTRAAIARAAEPLPEPGTTVSRGARHEAPPVNRPTVARSGCEEPPPEPGAALVGRPWFDPPTGWVRATFAAAEDAPPSGGSASAGKPPAPTVLAQQIPGRALVAFQEWPRPEPGWVFVVTGQPAGAAPPSLAGARPGGVFRRTDAGSRVFRRLPSMGATLAYQTRTKTPTQVIAVVFDFTNFPELTGAATIVSAVVTGVGGGVLSGLVAGTPAVLAAAAAIDALGNTVAAGKGVQVALAGGAAGQDVTVECAATLSTGNVAVVQGKVAVRNAV